MAAPEEDDFSYADDPELIDQFVTWTGEAVDELKEISSSLSESETKSGEVANRIYDLTHNIKGMGASFNFPLMTNTGSLLCNYIKVLPEGQPVSRRVVEAHVKVFDVVLSNKIQGDGGAKGDALMHRLAKIIEEEAA
jgi:chemotaxis protein histidine kinase CheA